MLNQKHADLSKPSNDPNSYTLCLVDVLPLRFSQARSEHCSCIHDTDLCYKIESDQISRLVVEGGENSADGLAVDVSAYADKVRGWSDIAASISLQTASIKAIDRTRLIQK
jgi:hypothetical protein